MMASNAGNSPNGNGAGKKRFGPINEEKDARGPQTGSVRMRLPSISMSNEECPIQVMRNPVAGGVL